MKVMFVTAGYLPDSIGGVELHVAGLARALREAGHEALVFTRTGREGVVHLTTVTDDVGGVPVVRMANTFEDATRLDLLYAHDGIAAAFLAEVERWKPDVVHVHHLTCLSVTILDRLRDAGIATVMTLHDFWMGCPRGQRITASLETCPEINLSKCLPCLRELWPHLLGREREPGVPPAERDASDLGLLEEYHATIQRVLSGVDRLVTPSAFMKRMYVAYGIDPRLIDVVENGLPTGRWTEKAPELLDHPGPVRVGFIGSVLPSKGVHLLLSAFRRLGDPGAMRLDIWGEVLPFHNDRNYGERLEELRDGFESSITLHGAYPNEDLPQLLAELDIVVVPSLWYEAYCLTIREAFLAGVPVITANHGAMAEAVVDGVSGLLFEAGDSASLASALRQLVDDAALRQRLAGQATRVRDESDAGRQLLELYDHLAHRPSA